MPKNISKEKSINRTKTTAELIVCAIFLGTAALIGKNCIDRSRIVPATQNEGKKVDEITIPDPSEAIDPNKIIFTSTPINTRAKFGGNLILVNNDYQYYATGEENLVSIMSSNDEKGRTSFTAVDYDYTILSNVYEPLAQMVDDWYELYHNDTLIVYGSYRTNDFQRQLYEQFTANTSGDGEAPIVAPPGFSEHETGLAFDFSETVGLDYQGTDDFLWLNENCDKYGFIIRYAEDKEDITEYRYEPWHFRYVGKPHAQYMKDNNICLEEYIELLRNAHPYSGEHLEVTDESGAAYEIYFVPSDDGSEYTNIPVPTGVKYDISGNNVDGFIITVHKDEKVSIGAENFSVTTSPPSTETTETADPESTSDSTETTAVY